MQSDLGITTVTNAMTLTRYILNVCAALANCVPTIEGEVQLIECSPRVYISVYQL